MSELVHALNRIESQTDHAKIMASKGCQWDQWSIKKEGKKFAYLDKGTSGVFLIERATGELYNIKGYGVPDYNKKQKADIGNLATVDVQVLHTKQYNYLR
jgi:hypothetical protein